MALLHGVLVIYCWCYFWLTLQNIKSVSIVSDYGLDDRAIEARSSVEAKGFFL
jgi:hypothetical protein